MYLFYLRVHHLSSSGQRQALLEPIKPFLIHRLYGILLFRNKEIRIIPAVCISLQGRLRVTWCLTSQNFVSLQNVSYICMPNIRVNVYIRMMSLSNIQCVHFFVLCMIHSRMGVYTMDMINMRMYWHTKSKIISNEFVWFWFEFQRFARNFQYWEPSPRKCGCLHSFLAELKPEQNKCCANVSFQMKYSNIVNQSIRDIERIRWMLTNLIVLKWAVAILKKHSRKIKERKETKTLFVWWAIANLKSKERDDYR